MSEVTDDIKRMESALDDDTTLSNEDKFRIRLALLEAKAGLCLSGSRSAEWVQLETMQLVARFAPGDIREDDQGYFMVEAVDRDAGRIRIKRAD